MTRAWSITLVLALIASIGAVLASQGKASAAVSVQLQCRANAPVVGWQDASNELQLEVVAPTKVKAGDNFTVTVQTPPGEMPTQEGSYGLAYMKDFLVKVPVPPNSTYVSSSMSGGFGLGTGTPTLSYEGGAVVLRVPGPINGGATYQFPQISMVLNASGPVGSTIEPRLGGTSENNGQTNPGFTLVPHVTGIPLVGQADVPTYCWPTVPVPVLSSTLIIPTVNTIPPEITINSPGDGLQYPKNANVKANYVCVAEEYYGGLKSCEGDVPSGTSIDTSTLGTHSFTVVAEDNDGLTSTKTVHYEVVAPGGDLTAPTVSITTPADGAAFRVGDEVTASFSCTDGGSGVATCEGTVDNGELIDTSTAGAKTFTVTATDNAGNQAQLMHGYTVLPTGAAPGAGQLANLSMSPSNASPPVNGAQVRWRVTAPVGNGGTLVPGDIVTVEWSIFKATSSCSITTNTRRGSNPITWVFDAPTNTTIVPGSVETSLTSLDGKVKGDAHEGGDFVGLLAGYPQATPSQATVSWDADSNPSAGFLCLGGQRSDGVIMQVSYQAQVTGTSGNVVVPGFPSGRLTGRSYSGTNWTAAAIAAPGVQYNIGSYPAPTVTINAPVDGSHVDYLSSVPASFECSSPAGIASCTGTVPNGAPIDTEIGGTRLFGATAVDNNGLSSGRWVSYVVDVPPPVAVDDTAQVAWSDSVDIDVLANDYSPYAVTPSFWDIDPTSVTIIDPPSHGTAEVLPDGKIRYTNADGAHTPSTITYQITNLLGDFSNTATVTVNMGIDDCVGSDGGEGCPLKQLIIVPVDADLMSMGQAANSTTLGGVFTDGNCATGPVMLDGTPQVACGDLQEVTVINARGNDAHWDLTAQVTDFNDDTRPPGADCSTQAAFDNHCIPGGNLGWLPSAVVAHEAVPGDVATVTVGAPINVPAPISQPAEAPEPPGGLKDSAQTLCSSIAKHSGGTFACNARLYLAVPASAAGGTYEAVLTLTLA